MERVTPESFKKIEEKALAFLVAASEEIIKHGEAKMPECNLKRIKQVNISEGLRHLDLSEIAKKAKKGLIGAHASAGLGYLNAGFDSELEDYVAIKFYLI